jgi:prepilin-type N-terminal cleavage/methylation domain-containing protein
MKCEMRAERSETDCRRQPEGRACESNAKCETPEDRRCSGLISSFILHPSFFSYAFSLVEVLAAIAIIGIVTFLAIPNIVRVKQDGEDNLARARAETLNMAIASYVQAVGTNTAATAWSGANADGRYSLIRPYVSFSEASLTAFTPSGYSFSLPENIIPMTNKTTISNSLKATNIYY